MNFLTIYLKKKSEVTTDKQTQTNQQTNTHRYLWHCDLKSGHELKSESQASESRNFARAEGERERERRGVDG